MGLRFTHDWLTRNNVALSMPSWSWLILRFFILPALLASTVIQGYMSYYVTSKYPSLHTHIANHFSKFHKPTLAKAKKQKHKKQQQNLFHYTFLKGRRRPWSSFQQPSGSQEHCANICARSLGNTAWELSFHSLPPYPRSGSAPPPVGLRPDSHYRVQTDIEKNVFLMGNSRISILDIEMRTVMS